VPSLDGAFSIIGNCTTKGVGGTVVPPLLGDLTSRSEEDQRADGPMEWC
jgi:hypothetical protein